MWQAFVNPDELAAWLMPNDFLPVVGYRFTLHCDPWGAIEAEVLEIDPPRRLACRWVASFGETLVTFELSPAGLGTRLRVEHRGWGESNSADRDQFDNGWTAKLNAGLPAVLEGAQ